MSAMKKIKEFCEAQGVDFSALEIERTRVCLKTITDYTICTK